MRSRDNIDTSMTESCGELVYITRFMHIVESQTNINLTCVGVLSVMKKVVF